jgi:hypothetical protein
MTLRCLMVLPAVFAVALTEAADEPKGKEKEKTVNEKVIEFCKKQVGKEVGDGECVSLANAALKEAGAKSLGAFEDNPGRGDYVWGDLVYERTVKDGKTAEEGKPTMVKPGDVIQYRDAKFMGRQGGGIYASVAAHHTAVVVGVSKDGKTFQILHQNINGKKEVSSGTVRLADLQEGWIRVYHPVPK